jgi:hypothetical protein
MPRDNAIWRTVKRLLIPNGFFHSPSQSRDMLTVAVKVNYG